MAMNGFFQLPKKIKMNENKKNITGRNVSTVVSFQYLFLFLPTFKKFPFQLVKSIG